MTRMRLVLSSATVLLVALLSAGCSSQALSNDPTKLDVAAVARNTTAFQATMLSDGKVDADEYERAVYATRDCVVKDGFAPDTPTWQHGELLFGVSITAPTDADLVALNAKYDAAYHECMSQYSGDVAKVWVNQTLLTKDARDAMRPDVIACLVAAGIHLDKDSKDDAIFAALTPDTSDKWAGCAKQFPAYFTAVPTGR